jgi:hypothetical protein
VSAPVPSARRLLVIGEVVRKCAGVAQMVERPNRNRRMECSNPPTGSRSGRILRAFKVDSAAPQASRYGTVPW